MDRKIIEAVDLLGTFEYDDPVRVTLKGEEPRDMWISRTIHRSDGAYGSYESNRVTATYGPGRYSCSITAEMLAYRRASIEKREVTGEAEPQKGFLVHVGTERSYEVVAVADSGKECHLWQGGPVLVSKKRPDGHWYFNERRVRFHVPEPGLVDEIMDLLEPVYGSLCFCGEDIDYDKPGNEGSEFTATEEFAKRYPSYTTGDAVIGHAQCGLDAGLEPA